MRVHRTVPAVVAAVTVAAAATVTTAGSAEPTTASEPATAAAESTRSYTNPVTEGVVDTFPDPTMIRGKDGAWYAYGTTNPIFNSAGETGEHILPVLRSEDMTSWEYTGDVYAAGEQPDWWPTNARAWAPDIRYIDETYYLTYSLSSGGVALATSASPTGPWEDHGLIIPAGGSGCPTGNIDQALFTDSDGTHYVYWGSYDLICVSAMNEDATALVGPVTQVAKGRRAEGAFVVERDGYYYMFYSDAGCCQGAFSGYTVKVGRAEDPRGPFVTRQGVDLMEPTSKGSIVAAANGNGWVGPGHSAIQTDLAGQDWLVYHAISADDPDFPPVDGATGGRLASLSKRPMMIDRLEWIDGWPVVRGGAGPSNGPQQAPVTTAAVGSAFDEGLPARWGSAGSADARWAAGSRPDAGGVAVQTAAPAEPAYLVDRRPVRGDVRVEGDVKLAAGGSSGASGLVLAGAGDRAGDEVVTWVDRAKQALVITVTADGETFEYETPLPDTFDYQSWHTLAIERRGSTVTAEVSADRLRDPLGRVSAELPAGARHVDRVGVASVGAPAVADNVSAVPLHEPVSERVPEPVLGEQLDEYSDEFDGTGRPETADPAWSWLRGEGSDATLGGGALNWSTDGTELWRGSNTAPVLLRDTPQGDFVVETKLEFDGDRPAQQAGLVLYENDDRYLKLTHTVLGMRFGGGDVFHLTEFMKEAERPTTTPPIDVFTGPMFGGPAADTTWLRLAYVYDEANDEHDVRMASSTDGEHWTWGGAWSLPARDPLRIGLITMNAPGAAAQFDYVRTYDLAATGAAVAGSEG
ncbi:glycosyl hydrolase family 43 [Haloactinopolyspora alba]|uniref:Glycosyl hydrolase family 43 n=1 Tax=Haloactinopolyspora alba TaxID=648780 RepID=A0A2P8EB33_9ACTN|nr:family 43 glycosylhydrolase [Haloactinopolyspora alba]PSL06681.1 glycosyl hydrolase family 43 [Haloactinopolyspora alba]